MSSLINLVSKSGKVYEVPKEATKISNMINSMLEDNDDIEIPLDLDDYELTKIVEFFNIYADNPLPMSTPEELDEDSNTRLLTKGETVKTTDMADYVKLPVYVNYINDLTVNPVDPDDPENLRKIMTAANYLHIEPLLHLAAVKFGTMILPLKKNPEKFKKILGLPANFDCDMKDVL